MPKRLAAPLAFFLLSAGAAALLARHGGEARETAPLERAPLERVVRVELERSGARLVLEKKAGRWSLLEPEAGPADAAAAEGLAAGLRATRLGVVVSRDPSQAAAYGLADLGATRARVFLEGEAAPALDGAFGSSALGGTAVYFRGARDAEIRLARGVPATLSLSAADYRARK